jgi:hypothetical protein
MFLGAVRKGKTRLGDAGEETMENGCGKNGFLGGGVARFRCLWGGGARLPCFSERREGPTILFL